MTSVILASGSPYRRALLERLAVPFSVASPLVDEDVLKEQWHHLSPAELAQNLASAKAMSISRQHPDAIIIGSDQLLSFQGKSLGKPHTIERAISQIESLQGQTHELITATVVRKGETELTDCNHTRLFMRALSRPEIERYVQHDQPLDCAGSYKFEKLGISLFERVELSDETAIQGLPLIFVSHALRRLGLSIP